MTVDLQLDLSTIIALLVLFASGITAFAMVRSAVQALAAEVARLEKRVDERFTAVLAAAADREARLRTLEGVIPRMEEHVSYIRAAVQRLDENVRHRPHQ